MEDSIKRIAGLDHFALVQTAECASTQEMARRHPYTTSSSMDSTVIAFHAWHQIAGVGRTGPWQTCAGNLAVTVSFPRDMFPPHYMYLHGTVAILQLFRRYGVFPAIKWPNDIVLDGAKCAGILCEQLENGRSLFGVGVNIRSAPQGATCARVLARGLNQDTGTVDLIGYLILELLAAAASPIRHLLDIYRHACTTIGKHYKHTLYGEVVIAGITESCCLIATLADKSMRILADVRSSHDLLPV